MATDGYSWFFDDGIPGFQREIRNWIRKRRGVLARGPNSDSRRILSQKAKKIETGRSGKSSRSVNWIGMILINIKTNAQPIDKELRLNKERSRYHGNRKVGILFLFYSGIDKISAWLIDYWVAIAKIEYRGYNINGVKPWHGEIGNWDHYKERLGFSHHSITFTNLILLKHTKFIGFSLSLASMPQSQPFGKFGDMKTMKEIVKRFLSSKTQILSRAIPKPLLEDA